MLRRAGEMSVSYMQVLVVDDEEPFRFLMASELGRVGHAVRGVKSGEEAFTALAAQDFDVVLLDLKMPGMGGMEALKRMKQAGVSALVVVLTGYPNIDDAIQAMKLGAYDYLTKPARIAAVEEVLKRAAEKQRLEKENLALRRMVAQKAPPPLILGHSPAIQSLLQQLERIAPADAHVLIQGETGTGKGLVAQAIQQQSRRAAQPFLTINCSAFQDALLESELFGHEKGAFTGAVGLKPGLFEVADGGTLFLDEVGEMSQAMQAKLLQVLDAGELRRVGGTKMLRVHVRIIAATNKDLAREVKAGRFREDLYYRLHVLSLHLPPLRERQEDIPILLEHFLHRFRLPGQPAKTMAPEVVASLTGEAWPGNIREVANTVERLAILVQGHVIGLDDLPSNARPTPTAAGDQEPSPMSLRDMERLHILKVLSYTGGKKAQAARLLGIDTKTLNHKLKGYHLPC
jgi:DNA-binding NtrC family response regulator